MEEMRGLPSHSEPLLAVAQLIFDQAQYLDDAPLTEGARKVLQSEMTWLDGFSRSGWVRMGAPPFSLSIGQTHPGDFLITDQGRAVLVDVENLHYGLSALDVGALSIYPSTAWDVGVKAELAEADVLDFHRHYLDALPSGQRAHAAAWLPIGRRIATLRALTWCCMWLVRHRRPGDQWAADRRPPGIIAHQRGLCQHLTSDNVVHALQSEWQNAQGLCARIDAL
jgi:hypothetical protein